MHLQRAHNKPPKKIPKNLGMIEVIRQKEDDHILPWKKKRKEKNDKKKGRKKMKIKKKKKMNFKKKTFKGLG
jgi:hypothetical protein